MSDYVLRGTKKLVDYMRSLKVDTHTGRVRCAAAVGLPLIVFTGPGREGASYVSPKYNEAQANALADILGVSVANVTTNGGQEIVG